MHNSITDPIATVCLVSPFPPPYGGMAVQALKLKNLLEISGYRVLPIPTNPSFPGYLKWVGAVPFLRSILTAVLFYRSLYRCKRQFDVVYFLTGFFNFFWWVTFPALLLIFFFRGKVILSARGGHAGPFFDRYKRFLSPLIKRIDQITTPSGFLQNEFIRVFDLYPDIVPNIADLDQFHFRLRKPLQPRLISTRNLEPIYNVGCTIRAFAIIVKAIPQATLTIVGEGSERPMLESLAADLRVAHAITFYGQLPHEQVQQLYDIHDIFINASNVDNLPGVILEAFACGLPVVTTRAGGIPFMVQNRLNALLVDCNDFQGLADQVMELLKNPDLAEELARNGHCESFRYSPDKVKETLLPILNKVIRKAPHA